VGDRVPGSNNSARRSAPPLGGSLHTVAVVIFSLLCLCACADRNPAATGDLSQPPVVATPDCASPAPQVAWVSGAQAFYVEYKSQLTANMSRTIQLAEDIGFDVMGSADRSFTVKWLEPVQVARIRCEADIALVAYVIPPPIVTGPTPESPTEKPIGSASTERSLTIQLDGNSTVSFALDGGRPLSVEVKVGSQSLTASLQGCALPSPIHVKSMSLIRDDLRTDKLQIDSLTLLFDVGLEQERRFEELPRVQLSWLDERLDQALITRLIKPNHGFSSPLCSGG